MPFHGLSSAHTGKRPTSRTSRTKNGECDALSRKKGSTGEKIVNKVCNVYGVDSTPDIDEPKGEHHWLVDSAYWQGIVIFIVCVNTLQLGVELEYSNPEIDRVYNAMEHIITAAFLAETIVKLWCLRVKYFYDAWNYLDGALVALSILDMWILRNFVGPQIDLQSLSVLRALRLVRLVRVVKLVKHFPRVLLLLHGIADAIRTTCWVSIVLFCAVYICAIFFVDTVGRAENAPELYPGYEEDPAGFDQFEIISEFNPVMYFGSLGRAMLTLFNIAIMAQWDEIITPVFFKQPALVFFFMVFGMFIMFGVMNVIVGLIVDNIMTQSRVLAAEREKAEAENLNRLASRFQLMFDKLDVDRDGLLSYDEILVSLNEGVMHTFFRDAGLHLFLMSPEELLRVMDEDGSGEVSGDEFVMGMFRLMGADNDKVFSSVCLSISQLKFSLREATERNTRSIEALEESVHALANMLSHHHQVPGLAVAGVNLAVAGVDRAREPPPREDSDAFAAAEGRIQEVPSFPGNCEDGRRREQDPAQGAQGQVHRHTEAGQANDCCGPAVRGSEHADERD